MCVILFKLYHNLEILYSHNIDDKVISVSPQTGKDNRNFIICDVHKYCIPLLFCVIMFYMILLTL